MELAKQQFLPQRVDLALYLGYWSKQIIDANLPRLETNLRIAITAITRSGLNGCQSGEIFQLLQQDLAFAVVSLDGAMTSVCASMVL